MDIEEHDLINTWAFNVVSEAFTQCTNTEIKMGFDHTETPVNNINNLTVFSTEYN